MTNKQIEITFDMPSTFTLGMWETYTEATSQFVAEMRRQGRPASNLVSQAVGAVALIKAQYVHFTGPAIVQKWIDDPLDKTVPLAFIGEVARKIGGAIEESVNFTLADYLKAQFDTTETESDTPAQPD